MQCPENSKEQGRLEDQEGPEGLGGPEALKEPEGLRGLEDPRDREDLEGLDDPEEKLDPKGLGGPKGLKCPENSKGLKFIRIWLVRSGKSRGGMEVCNEASENNVACDLVFFIIDHRKSAQ